MLSKAARRVLTHLHSNRDSGDGELVREGREVWYGRNRTSPRVVKELLMDCLIRDVSCGKTSPVRRYKISNSGERLLNGLPPYRSSDGKYYSTLAELVAAVQPAGDRAAGAEGEKP